MKVKVYLVTYRNDGELVKTIDSYINSGLYSRSSLTVVNNHTAGKPRIGERNYFTRLISNEARPDFSTGHLSRNWNECLMDGFQNLNSPDADVVICCQNDVRFKGNCLEIISRNLRSFDFMTAGSGDAACAYSVEAVKKVGLWDERICNIGYQESDYFLRQFLYNRDRCSVNDNAHGRVHNPIESFLENSDCGYQRQCEHHLASMTHHDHSRQLVEQKWKNIKFENWDDDFRRMVVVQPNLPQFVLYPYFEKDIPHRERIGYYN